MHMSRLGLYASSAVALLSSMAVNLAHRFQTREERPTPRKPERKRGVVYAAPARAKARADAQAAFTKQMRKEREIGVDPVYRNQRSMQTGLRKEWLKQSREWDQANAGLE